ncbi:hypothetical protein GWI34_38385, partial [Actinomadura sp. DSM 109109]|nr:hypothetical protein [Actinomadura lepetitiana]
EPESQNKQKAEDVILANLPRTEDEAATAHEVTENLARAGHRVAHGTVRNTLRGLLDAGAVQRTKSRPHRYWKEGSSFSDEDLRDWIGG